MIGAEATINTDLYYQRTLPALIAQMDASQLKAKMWLLQGLGKPDQDYPLGRALVELNTVEDAGDVTQAIQDLSTLAATPALATVHGQAILDTVNARHPIVDDINALSDTPGARADEADGAEIADPIGYNLGSDQYAR